MFNLENTNNTNVLAVNVFWKNTRQKFTWESANASVVKPEKRPDREYTA